MGRVRNRGDADLKLNASEVAKELCELCPSSSVFRKKNIAIVSDSKVDVAWVNDSEGIGSLEHVNLIFDIRGWMQLMGGMTLTFNSRATNSFADNLAKSGSSLRDDKLVWEWS
ncbi:hypothetical protein Q3G72_005935 [Acer saccharum]|nr:hypothetical protein Q3G72_005935 [Acer saccharum]